MSEKMTFNDYAKYLNRKEEAIRNAVSEALGMLRVPIECSSSVQIQIDLVEATRMDSSFREFIVSNVDIKVGVEF